MSWESHGTGAHAISTNPRTPDEFAPFENLAAYAVDEEKRERMLAEQLECVVVWTNAQSWPIGVVHWFVWRDGRFWVTCATARRRVSALRARPQSCVIVSSVGTSLGRAQSVTAKTVATVRDDAATKGWFFPMLAEKSYPDDDVYRPFFLRMLQSTDRVVIELEPVQWVSYDALKMAAVVRGRPAAPEQASDRDTATRGKRQ